MQHEGLGDLLGAVDRVDALFVPAGPQRHDAQRLGLAAREEGGAVRSGQNTGLADDGTDLVGGAAVGPDALIEDACTDMLLFQ